MPGAAVDTEPRMTDIRALVLNCTLKPAPAESSADLIGTQVLDELRKQGAEGEVVRVVDQGVRFGVSTDEGDGDGWPVVRQKMLASDVLVLATPIWLGQPSAVCKMVLEPVSYTHLTLPTICSV